MPNITGTNGDDVLTGTSGDDIIFGLNGRDWITGGAGADSINAGQGNDIVYGGAGNDTIQAQAGGDQLYGGDGNDRLFGQSGNDYLVGGLGNDRLNGGTGNDVMEGGPGNDLYVVGEPSDVVIELAGEGTDTVYTSINWSLGDHFERLTLVGTANIDGTGNALDNIIRGNSGENALAGGAGSDQLLGGQGDDWLEGGAGRDIVRGGFGADTFIFRDGDFAGMTAATADRILDFISAQGDKVHLAFVDANTLADGDQQFDFIGSAAFTSVAGELRYEVINGHTFLFGDTDGDGSADFMVQLVGTHSLTGADFVL